MTDEEEARLHPRHTRRLLGQDDAERLFLEQWNAERPAHAWLITGPRGVGKATLAYRIARFVLNAGGGDADGPGLFGDVPAAAPVTSLHMDPEHPIFRRVGSGGHSDLLTVERAVNPDTKKLRRDIAVADIRRVPHFFSLTAGEGAWRVVIVDSADDLNTSSANALLKELEEPPNRAMLLLISHAPSRLLPTIRSRCRPLRLQLLDEGTVADILADILPDMDPQERLSLSRLAEGSPGDALELSKAGGLDLYRGMLKVMETLGRLDIVTADGFAETLGRNGREAAFQTVGRLLDRWLSDLVLGSVHDRSIPEVVGGELAIRDRMRSGAGLDEWVGVWENVGRLFSQAEQSSLDRRIVALNAFESMNAAMRGRA